jgi:hypothetical protein
LVAAVPPVTVCTDKPIVTTELPLPALAAAQLTLTVPVGANVVQLPYVRGYRVLTVVVKLLTKPAEQPRVERH